MQASTRVCKRVSKGCSSPLLPGVKRLSCTHMLLAFCSPLPPRCFVKPQTHLTQQLNYPEARSWKCSSSSAMFTSSIRCFPSAWRCHLLMPFPSPFGSLVLVSPPQTRTRKAQPSDSSAVGPEENQSSAFVFRGWSGNCLISEMIKSFFSPLHQ